ncbi:probable methyltransferase PMT27 [Aristolochia californica]|uniref:probable methyltransferase PMT27 n=1 Tax=Aristolochia californica TaxID=171875 RepID=UPI0035DEC657
MKIWTMLQTNSRFGEIGGVCYQNPVGKGGHGFDLNKPLLKVSRMSSSTGEGNISGDSSDKEVFPQALCLGKSPSGKAPKGCPLPPDMEEAPSTPLETSLVGCDFRPTPLTFPLTLTLALDRIEGTQFPNWAGEEAILKLQSTKHYEHRERHCPEEGPTCLVTLHEGYKWAISWPDNKIKIWYHNVPHTKLVVVKGHLNWVKVTGKYLTFPGGGTQFKHGALHYLDFVQETFLDIAWGKRSCVVLDIGCGAASFGG